ncbi:MAG: hypothetical protein AAFO98_01835 [Pseudomonadota bacterium]
MTDDEIFELRVLLSEEVAKYSERADIVTDAFERLGAGRAHLYVTEAEILVFDIPRAKIPALQVAYMGYEDLHDLAHPPFLSEEAQPLIAKAREIVPPIKSYWREVPFEAGSMALQSFQWFAKSFCDLSNRHAAAIYAKHEWNTSHLIQYRDESRQ